MGFQIKMWLAFSLAVIKLLVLGSKIFNPNQEKMLVNISYFIKCSFGKFEKFVTFFLSHFGCYTLYSARHFSEMAFSALLYQVATLENTMEISLAFAERRKKEKLTGTLEKIFISNSTKCWYQGPNWDPESDCKEDLKRSGSGTCCQLHFDYAHQAEEWWEQATFQVLHFHRCSRLRNSDLLGAYICKGWKSFCWSAGAELPRSEEIRIGGCSDKLPQIKDSEGSWEGKIVSGSRAWRS